MHGLLVDVGTGKLDWLVNGYQTLDTLSSRWQEVAKSAGHTVDALKSLTDFNIGEMKFPETKIGEIVTRGENWLSEQMHQLGTQSPPVPAEPKPAATQPKIPLPPPIRPRVHLGRGRK